MITREHTSRESMSIVNLELQRICEPSSPAMESAWLGLGLGLGLGSGLGSGLGLGLRAPFIDGHLQGAFQGAFARDVGERPVQGKAQARE